MAWVSFTRVPPCSPALKAKNEQARNMKDLGNRYAKFNCNIMQSKWYRNMPPEPRLCWHYLILHAKAFGISGIFDPIDTEYFAETWRVSETAVLTMIESAVNGEALSCQSSEWCITHWAEHQGDPTASERMARFRERQRTQVEPPVTDVTRNERNVTDVTHITTTTITTPTTTEEGDKPRPRTKKVVVPFTPPTQEEVMEYMQSRGWKEPLFYSEKWVDHYQPDWKIRGGKPMTDWQRAVRTWEEPSRMKKTAGSAHPEWDL